MTSRKPINTIKHRHKHQQAFKSNMERDFYLEDLKEENPEIWKREVNDRQRGLRTLKQLSDEDFLYLIRERYSNLS